MDWCFSGAYTPTPTPGVPARAFIAVGGKAHPHSSHGVKALAKKQSTIDCSE